MQVFKKHYRAMKLALGGVALVALASCGSGGSDDGGAPAAVTPPATSTGIPSTASGSVSGFIAFLKTLTPTQQNSAQPLDTTGFVAPVDNTGLPDPSI